MHHPCCRPEPDLRICSVKKTPRHLGVSSMRAAIQLVMAGKTQISNNNGLVPSGAWVRLQVNQRSQQPLGPPVKLHPLIKKAGFPRHSYNVSCVQPVHYEPPVPSSFCCSSTTRVCFFLFFLFSLFFDLINHISITE